jgi:hypothetical protein
MEDVLELYAQPYDPEFPVVCMDETSKQLVGETRIPIPAKSGRLQRIDYEYERRGTADVFMFTEPLRNWRKAVVTQTRTRLDWAVQVRILLECNYPKAKRVRLVMDNLNVHSIGSLYEAFPPDEARRLANRLEIHYTPKHGSWLNIAEIELRALNVQCMNRRIPESELLQTEIEAWMTARNSSGAKVDWQYTTSDARIHLKHLYPKIQP